MAIITLVERSKLEMMQHQQRSIQIMATTLGCSRLSIRRELNRCPDGNFCAIDAQEHADHCRHRCGRHSILTSNLKRVVTEKLRLGWSPEMVGHTVHLLRIRFTTGFIVDKSTFNRLSSLIMVNVTNEETTFGRDITNQ